jgi:CheY-like chemotaxis protein
MHDAPTILLIDHDEENFRYLAARLRSVVPVPPRVVWACSSADAVAYLEGRDGYDDRKFFPLPDVVLLSPQSPATANYDLVRWLRGQGGFRALPVLALCACGDEFDASRAAAAGVSAFFHQPCDERRLTEMLAGVVAHWRQGDASCFGVWPGAVALPAQSCAA